MTEKINNIYVAQGSYKYLPPDYKEAELQSAIIGYLVRLGCVVKRINAGAATSTYKGKKRYIQFVKWYAPGLIMQGKGVVDLEALFPDGQLWAIDVKNPAESKSPQALYNRLTNQQEEYLKHVAQNNGIAAVTNNIDAFYQLINEVRNV